MKMSTKISSWLYICAGSVFLMALIGAITRLTESGLSIVEWKPVTGALPPMSDTAWQAEFDLYRQSPQGQTTNSGMTLDEFKNIFFWEWLHRLWGRLIGVVYAVPLLFFWRHIPRHARPSFVAVLLLGFLQGGMGWYMVKSGLVDVPAVSHYRLAAHLMLAFLIYASLFRLGLSFSVRPDGDAAKLTNLRGSLRICILLAALTMTWGAFVAGLDAGMVYNTFPMMDDHWYPPELLQHRPLWMAFYEEPATVQFTHRILAILTVIKIFATVSHAKGFNPPPRVRGLFRMLGLMALVQVGLGIATLLTQVDLHLAVLHQAGAMIVLALLVWLLHEIPAIRQEKHGHA